MVRAWHPELISTLDDNRLSGMHVEVHMMHAALEKQGGWFAHPETQVWWGRECQLRGLHCAVVHEMAVRGFVHKSPLTGTLQLSLGQDWVGLPEVPYKPDSAEWYLRDAADLFVKFEKEQRWDANGFPQLGRRRRDGTFAPPRREFQDWELVKLHRSKLEAANVRIGERVWTQQQRDRLSRLVKLRRSS